MSSTTTTTTKMFNTKSAEVRDLQKELKSDLGRFATTHLRINNIGDNVFFEVLPIKVPAEHGNVNSSASTSTIDHQQQQQQPRSNEQVNVAFCQFVRAKLNRLSVEDAKATRKELYKLLGL